MGGWVDGWMDGWMGEDGWVKMGGWINKTHKEEKEVRHDTTTKE